MRATVKLRNPDALCANCQMFENGNCHMKPVAVQVRSDYWCGSHPDLWKYESITIEMETEEVTDGEVESED